MAKPISFMLKALLVIAVTTGCMLAGGAFSSRIIDVSSQPPGATGPAADQGAPAGGVVSGAILSEGAAASRDIR